MVWAGGEGVESGGLGRRKMENFQTRRRDKAGAPDPTDWTLCRFAADPAGNLCLVKVDARAASGFPGFALIALESSEMPILNCRSW